MTPLRDEDLAAAAASEDEEVVDALPVPAAASQPQPPAPRTSLLPGAPVGVQAAAVAVGGFVAGAATVAVVRHRRVRKATKRGRKARRELGQVLGSRSFLVDVHLLGSRD